jgi:glycosyltransferase involved in cell wall biosynthesis
MSLSLTFVMSALNEEKNVRNAIVSVRHSIDKKGIQADLIVINDGSIDRTKEIILEEMKKDSRISLIDHERPHGVGGSFWEGVQQAKGDVVCFTPGDNENDPDEIIRYLPLLEQVDIVVPFIFNTNVRSRFRRWLSKLYLRIINHTFGLNLNYTNGTVMYRTKVLKTVDLRNFGFLYQAELLIKLIKAGYLFAEVPCGLSQRSFGKSKATSLKSLFNVMKGYISLFREIYFTSWKNKTSLLPESATAKRIKELT